MTYELSAAEKTFALRMFPHLAAGMSFEQAGRAVLADDARIADAVLASDGVDAIHGDTFTKAVSTTPARRGAFIRSEMSRTVYDRQRAA